MSILQECPICKRKQKASNKNCNECDINLDRAKRSKRVRYWINYRLPDGKQRRESVGYSIKEARDANGKRHVQKRENRIFDMLPESKITFNELAKWYLNLARVKQLSDYIGVKIRLNNFNSVHGDKIVKDIKPTDIENYQTKRQSQGIKNTTIDHETNIVKIMINKGFDNDIVDGRTLKTFRKIRKVSTKAERTRTRTLSIGEYLGLLNEAKAYFKPVLILAFHTGMRSAELEKLKWSYIDRKADFIRLPASATKGKAARNIPINHHVKAALDSLPRALNHDFVFTRKGKHLKRHGGRNEALEAACQGINIPYGRKAENGLILHDFRRTFKTNMLRAGVDKTYRDKIAGHTLQGIDVHYIILTENDLHHAMDKYTKWIDSEIVNVDQTVDQTQII